MKSCKNIAVVAAVLAMIVLSACATPKGPILVEAVYEAPEDVVAEKSKVVVGLSPFRDERAKKKSLAGERVTASGDFQNDLVVQGTVADMVTEELKKAFEARGITVKDVPAWDLNPENLKAEGVDIVVGGRIRTLWVKAATQTFKVNTQANVAFRIVAADAKEKNVIQTLNLSGMYGREDASFSVVNVDQALSVALSSTIDQFMNDAEIKKRIK